MSEVTNAQIILSAISCVIMIVALIYGAKNLLGKGRILYFHIIMWGGLCYTLQTLVVFVELATMLRSDLIIISAIATLGFSLSFLLVNYGVLDRLVDERSESTLAGRKKAYIAPAFFAVVAIVAFVFYTLSHGIFWGIIFTVAYLPLVPASYFNYKHIIIPVDASGLLAATKPCNKMCLVLYFLMFLRLILDSFLSPTALSAYSVLLALGMMACIFASVKGAKSWEV